MDSLLLLQRIKKQFNDILKSVKLLLNDIWTVTKKKLKIVTITSEYVPPSLFTYTSKVSFCVIIELWEKKFFKLHQKLDIDLYFRSFNSYLGVFFHWNTNHKEAPLCGFHRHATAHTPLNTNSTALAQSVSKGGP